MKQRNKKRYEAKFKARVAIDALKERETLAQLGHRHGVHPVQVGQWRRQLEENAPEVFGGGAETREFERERNELLQKIGELTVERDFLSRGLQRPR